MLTWEFESSGVLCEASVEIDSIESVGSLNCRITVSAIEALIDVLIGESCQGGRPTSLEGQ
jgi:hypothetical protein